MGEQLPAFHQQRLTQAVADAFGELGGLLRVGEGLGEDGELITAQPGHGVGRADQGGQPDRDRLQQPVADRVAGAVVDLLEVVQVHQQHTDAAAAAGLAGQRLLEPVAEQGPVGEPGEGVVQGLVAELVFELLAVGDVAAVEHDALDRGLAELAGQQRLHVAPGAVGTAQPPLGRQGHARAGLGRRQHRRQLLVVVGVQQGCQAAANQTLGLPAQQTLGAGAGVGDGGVRADDQDQVRAVLDQRAEVALPAGQLGGALGQFGGALLDLGVKLAGQGQVLQHRHELADDDQHDLQQDQHSEEGVDLLAVGQLVASQPARLPAAPAHTAAAPSMPPPSGTRPPAGGGAGGPAPRVPPAGSRRTSRYR